MNKKNNLIKMKSKQGIKVKREDSKTTTERISPFLNPVKINDKLCKFMGLYHLKNGNIVTRLFITSYFNLYVKLACEKHPVHPKYINLNKPLRELFADKIIQFNNKRALSYAEKQTRQEKRRKDAMKNNRKANLSICKEPKVVDIDMFSYAELVSVLSMYVEKPTFTERKVNEVYADTGEIISSRIKKIKDILIKPLHLVI